MPNKTIDKNGFETSPKEQKPLYDTDGALIEGRGVGGNVLIVSKEPEFIRDVCPYFAPSIVLVFAHIIYVYSGKLVMPVVLVIVACPLVDRILKDDV